MKAIAFFDGSRGYLAVRDELRGVTEVVTTRAYSGHNIRIDDRKNYPQLCEGGRMSGLPLAWAQDATRMGRHFARDCGAKFYKNRQGYEGGFERMKADAD